MGEFWTSSDEYGSLHELDPDGPNPRPDILIVFVHGILGSSKGTWQDIPQELLKTVGFDADVFSFDYPSMPWQRSRGVEEAAQHLLGWIEEREDLRGRYRFIICYTHSLGGLVVKELLVREYENTLRDVVDVSDASKRPEYRELSPAVTRFRRIENVCVPHRGASWTATLLVL